ncbi:trichothecene 3-O-acetyltransferase tri101 [Colletotrichum liriopes]|uniref:Trichothecene 3-O-acetyltransferase tri101 n=1 Tax=Colletotrichum liriopes TaxID=708192 RepID=A0AA37LV52_9PEZI|nr:trichothecene 3-O-acetyltransferase tri101 [Colletotrichum liriopes]
MSSRQSFQLLPLGQENDPEEERFKLSTIDPTPNCAYNHYALFFRLEDSEKSRAVDVLKAGLERTLSQARYLCGTIEKDLEGGYSFVKRRDSTVQFVLHRLDPHGNHPSLDDIEKSYFSGQSLQDVHLWSVPGLTWGERPEANPDNSPVVAAYQLNLLEGGLLFSMHHHHYSCDLMGWSNFTRQLAENCYAIANSTSFPPWDPANIDVSRFTKTLPAESLVDGPPVAQKHPDHPEQQAVLFHLPKSKAEELKKLATSTDPEAPWISTYDAMCAYVWRMLSKVRAPLYKPDPFASLWWGEAVNMRPRLHTPPVPGRMMRNAVAGAFSDTAPVPPLAAGDVISDAPLSKLAGYIRALTESCTEQHVERLIELLAPIRDKRTISLRVDAHPPMSMFVTDHRSADVSGFDFGFAKPITYRHLWGNMVTAGVVLVYAPIQSPGNPDEGFMFAITMEKDLVPKLRESSEWSDYFEYRGVD